MFDELTTITMFTIEHNPVKSIPGLLLTNAEDEPSSAFI